MIARCPYGTSSPPSAGVVLPSRWDATEITLGRRQGMISLEDSLARLVQDGAITADDARVRSTRPDELESLLRGPMR